MHCDPARARRRVMRTPALVLRSRAHGLPRCAITDIDGVHRARSMQRKRCRRDDFPASFRVQGALQSAVDQRAMWPHIAPQKTCGDARGTPRKTRAHARKKTRDEAGLMCVGRVRCEKK